MSMVDTKKQFVMVMISALFAAVPSRGDDPSPQITVGIGVDVHAVQMKILWSKPTEVMGTLREFIVESMRAELPKFWHYAATGSADGFKLRFEVSDRTAAGEILLSAKLLRPDGIQWNFDPVVWQKSAGWKGFSYPPPSEVPEQLTRAFVDLFLAARRDEMTHALKEAVPLGHGARWLGLDTPNPKIVLGLDPEFCEPIRNGIFKIGDARGSGVGMIESYGANDFVDYTPAPPDKGLVTLPKIRWIGKSGEPIHEAIPEVRNWQLGDIYLENESYMFTAVSSGEVGSL